LETLTNNCQKNGIGYAYLLLFGKYDLKQLTFLWGFSSLLSNALGWGGDFLQERNAS
jgi:hypothetical protein